MKDRIDAAQEQPQATNFENIPPIGSEREALVLLAPWLSDPGAEAKLVTNEDGAHIHQVKLMGYPEHPVWERWYRVHNDIAQSLQQNGLVDGSDGHFRISQKGHEVRSGGKW